MSEPVGRHSDTIQVDGSPTAKVTAGTLTGALATALLFVADRFGLEMSAGEGAAFATLVFYTAAWWKKSRPGDNDR